MRFTQICFEQTQWNSIQVLIKVECHNFKCNKKKNIDLIVRNKDTGKVFMERNKMSETISVFM